MEVDEKEYVSCIWIAGQPIIPPVMDSEIRREMQEYRKLAVMVERKLVQQRTDSVVSRLDEILQKLEDDQLSISVCSNTSEEDAITNDLDAMSIHKNETVHTSNVQDKFATDTNQNFLFGESQNIDSRVNLSFQNISDAIDKKNDDRPKENNNNDLKTAMVNGGTSSAVVASEFIDVPNDLTKSPNYAGYSGTTLETASALTFYTESTDISPYMKIKANLSASSADTHLTSDVKMIDVTDLAGDGVELTTENVVDPLLERVESSTSTSVNSSTTVLDANCEGANATPVKVRRNSYTLETPSPALLKHMLQPSRCSSNSESSDDSVKADNNIECVDAAFETDSVDKLSDMKVSQEKLSNLGCSAVDNEKQLHLRKYLEQLSRSSPSHQFSSSYFPSVDGQTTSYQPGRKALLFPDVYLSDDKAQNEEPAYPATPIEIGSNTSQSRQLDSSRLSTHVDEMFKSKDSAFEVQHTNLQKQHQQQIEALLRNQWQEQVEMQKHFMDQHEETMKRISRLSATTSPLMISNDFEVTGKDRSSCHKSHVTDSLVMDVNVLQSFNKLSALVKGYLTRQLMKSEKVQNQIQMIKDTLSFALKFQAETTFENHKISAQDVALHRRLISQVTAACHQLHDIFFKTSKAEQIQMIRQSRLFQAKKAEMTINHDTTMHKRRRLSSATLKYRARKFM